MNKLLTNHAYRKFRVYQHRYLRYDLLSGLVVFLVAVPLCLGIALASGAPLLSGIISGIVGGIIVGIFSASQVSVSGPAAGIAAIVVAAITQLGDFQIFLLAVVLAGVLQIIIGALRAGFIADYIPSNVIQGLLCAIGILLIVKQLPLAFTLSHTVAALKMQLLDSSESLTLEPLQELTFHLNSGALLLSLLSLSILLFTDKTRIACLKYIPGPIIVVAFSICLNEIFLVTSSTLAQNELQMVQLPQHDGFGSLLQALNHPNWSALSNPKVYLYAFILTVVASLESLLNIKAGEKLDKKRRYCSKDRELIAQGLGNTIAGLIGAIPITSVVIRTSVNIQTGAKTKMSSIFHGVFLLTSLVLFPRLLNKIPLCSLAMILIYTGYKLTKPSIYRVIYQQGMDRFLPFITTVVCIITFDLLVGILLGLISSLFFILKSNSQSRLDIIKEIYPKGITHRLILPQQTTFLNKATLVAELDTIPSHSQLIIDARYSNYIDKEISEFIKEFQQEQAPLKNISLNLIGFKQRYDIHNYVDFINVTTYDVQASLTPKKVLNILREGNQRFLNETPIYRSLKTDIKYTASTQHPIAIVLGCVDSRVPVETVFDMSFGDLFCVRIAGNVINNDILASMEYACGVIGAKLIVVLGHTRCGAIAAACDNVEQGHITELLDKIKPAIAVEKQTANERKSSNTGFVNNVTQLNIANTLQHIYQQSTTLRKLIDNDDVGITGAIYDVTTGVVSFDDFSSIVGYFADKDTENNHLPAKLHSLMK